MGRKTTSLKIDENLWKDVKIYCIKHNLEISEFLEKLLKREVK